MEPQLLNAFREATTEHFGALAKSFGLRLAPLKPEIYEIHAPACRVRILWEEPCSSPTRPVVFVEPKSRDLLLAEGHHDLALRIIAEYYGDSLPTLLPAERPWLEDDVRSEIQMLAQKTGTLCHRFLAGDTSDWQALESWFKRRRGI
jgi:hypothetical protein